MSTPKVQRGHHPPPNVQPDPALTDGVTLTFNPHALDCDDDEAAAYLTREEALALMGRLREALVPALTYDRARDAFREGRITTEQLAAAIEADFYVDLDLHGGRVMASMLKMDRDDGRTCYANTGGNIMCLEAWLEADGSPWRGPAGWAARGRRLLIGEDGCAEDGFGWAVDHDATGDAGGTNYSVAVDTSEWTCSTWLLVFAAILRNPTSSDPITLPTGTYDVQTSEY